MNPVSAALRRTAPSGLVSMISFYRIRHSSSGLRSARVAMRKRFGQHLLTNPETVRKIVECAEVKPHESVFEIGPGTGNLTMHLLQAAHTVYAVELDEKLADILVARVQKVGAQLAAQAQAAAEKVAPGASPHASSFSACSSSVGDALSVPAKDRPVTPYLDRLRLCLGDFLRTPLPPFHVLCANIPYQISSPVLRRLLGHAAALHAQAAADGGPVLSRIVLLLQLEFALRMVAKPGTADYCRLSVNTALLCSHASIPMRIGREQFRPPPKVDSAVIKLVPCVPPAAVEGVPLDLVQWDALLRLCFQGKNKTLRASMCGNRHTLARLAQLRQGGAGAAAVEQAEGAEEGADMVVQTAAGAVPRALLHATRDTLISACRAALGWREEDPNSGEGARPNGLSLPQYLQLYKHLYGAGFRFVVGEAQGTGGAGGTGTRSSAEGVSVGEEAEAESVAPTASTTYSGPRHDLGPVSVWDASSLCDPATTARLYWSVAQHGARMNTPPPLPARAGGTRRSLLLYPPPPAMGGTGDRGGARKGARGPSSRAPPPVPPLSPSRTPSLGRPMHVPAVDGRSSAASAEEEEDARAEADMQAAAQAKGQARLGASQASTGAHAGEEAVGRKTRRKKAAGQ